MTRRTCLAAALAGFVLVAATASAAPGQLDPSFSGDGWVRTYDVRGGSTPPVPRGGATGLAVQADGKVVTVGPLDGAFGAYRWLPNGDLDRAFGANGVAVARSRDDDEAFSVAVQRDGRILLAGRGECAFLSCAMVVRLLPDGRLDAGFGRSGFALAATHRCPAVARDVTVQRDGKIVVAGSRPRNDQYQDDAMFAVARFTANGRLDARFSRDGCVSVDFSTADDRAHAVVLQPDGRILIAGNGSRRSGNDFAFVRLRANGSLDRTFSKDGRHTVDFGRGESAHGLALQPNGRIVAAGFTGPETGAGQQTAAVVRLLRNGALDRSFGSRGRLLLRPSRHGSFASDVLVLPGARILVAGGAVENGTIGSSSDWVLARLRSDGRPDLSWGRGGLALGDFGTGEDWAAALALQRDGRIVVAGQVYRDQAIARYLAR